jgi:hypothetical protein
MAMPSTCLRSISLFTVVVAALLAGCSSTQPAVLGKAPSDGAITPISAITQSAKPQTIQGVMIDKCPVAGCWFHVRDNSGVVKVDTKYSGFVVMDVPVNSRVTVSGVYQAGSEQALVASGMSYQ